jgi:O-antigen/teichoic acid export membrane protein
MVAQLGAQVVLARLLVPADYGVFSILLLTITLAGYFGELGGAALLVKK